jgi:FdhD protein
MNTAAYNALRVAQKPEETEDVLSIEIPLEIRLNGEEFSTTMCSPQDAEALVRGLFYSEDLWRGEVEHLKVHPFWDEERNVFCADVNLEPHLLGDGYQGSRKLLSVTSCGICGSPNWQPRQGKQLQIEALPSDPTFIPQLFKKMQEKQSDFKASGGSHAAAIFSKSGEFLSLGQDIGRHNATDKAIGLCILNKTLPSAACLLVSGRAKTPILAAVSAPSSLAVDFAEELGICLLGFCRDQRYTIYSHPEHLNYGA